MSESTQTKLLSSVPAISSLAEGDKITVVTASGQTALVSLSTLLGAVKVGGRNLIKDSGRQRSSGEYYLGRYEYGDDAPQVRETVLVSLWGTPAPGKVFNAFNSGGDGNSGTTRLTQDKDGVYRGRLEIKKPDAIFAVFASPGSDKTISTIDRVKVERGDIPTDWTPAPEDLNWGGVISSFSEASKASARISKKGGQHEYIDNTDKGSHQCGTEGDTLGCAGEQGASCRHRRMPNPRVLLLCSFVRRPSIVPNKRLLLSANNEIKRHSGTSTLPRDGECYDSLQNRKHSERYRKCEMEEDKLLVYRLALGKEVAA